MKGSAFARFAFSRNKTPVILYYFFTHGKTDAGAAVFSLFMQALKNGKDLFFVFGREADAVIFKYEVVIVCIACQSFYFTGFISCKHFSRNFNKRFFLTEF